MWLCMCPLQFTSTPCRKICQVPRRVMSSARFDDSTTSVTVQLNTDALLPANPTACAYLFNADTNAKLGNASCSAKGSVSPAKHAMQILHACATHWTTRISLCTLTEKAAFIRSSMSLGHHALQDTHWRGTRMIA